MFERIYGQGKLTDPLQRPPDFDRFLLRYNEIKEDPTIETDFRDKAIIMIVEFQLALEKGIKHYHPDTGKELSNLTEIFEVLADHNKGEIIIKMP